jgi:hypothetical protein
MAHCPKKDYRLLVPQSSAYSECLSTPTVCTSDRAWENVSASEQKKEIIGFKQGGKCTYKVTVSDIQVSAS